MHKIKENCKTYGVWEAVVRNAATGEIVRKKIFPNLVPTVARAAMAQQHAGTNVQQMKVTYIAVGDDPTTPTNTDTILGNETARKALGSNTASSVESSVAVFFAAGEATGSHKEVGAFGDGASTTASASADSGILYSHASIDISVAADETLTLTLKTSFT